MDLAPAFVGKHQYYVIFLNDYSKFIWIYFVKRCFEVIQVFLNFQQLVEANLAAKLLTCKLLGW
jgi:hypothetical protein